MPAPTQGQIKANLEASLIAAGFTEKVINEDGTVTDTGRLHADQKRYIEALSKGIADTWEQWVQVTIIKVDPNTFIGKII